MALKKPIVLCIKPEERSESEIIALIVNGFQVTATGKGLVLLKYSVPGLPTTKFIMFCRSVSIFEVADPVEE